MARSTQRVIFEREDDGTWTARLASSKRGAAARGGSVAQARKRMRALLLEDGSRRRARDVEVVDEIHLPPAGRAAVERVTRARAVLEAAQREAVITLVRRLGLGTREAAGALGMTMRRVVHLAGEAADVEAEAKAERRPRRPPLTR